MLNRSGKTFNFQPEISIKGSWMIGMIGLTSLEVNNSNFNINTTNNEFELYANNFDEFSFEDIKDQLQEVLNFSDITPNDLQHEKQDRLFLKHIRN